MKTTDITFEKMTFDTVVKNKEVTMNLDKSIYSEANISKKPALELLRAMGYTYLSPEECRQQRGSGYRVLLRDVLRGQLRKLNRYTYGGVENEFSAVNIEHAMDLSGNTADGRPCAHQ